MNGLGRLATRLLFTLVQRVPVNTISNLPATMAQDPSNLTFTKEYR